MKTAFALMLSFAAVTFAADPITAREPETKLEAGKNGEVKRLGTVTWDLSAHKLIWTVQKGSMVNGEFVLSSEEKYAISPDQARMMVADEARGFDGQEALSLHKLLDVLSLYCAESVVWWDQGQGMPGGKVPVSGPESPRMNGTEKPVKVGQPEQKKPKYKVPEGQIIARVRF